MEKLNLHSPDGNSARWVAPVSCWSVWQAQADGDVKNTPDVAFVDASLRRRLSLFARMALKVAHDCAGDLVDVRIVFASRHGDLGRTTSMLVDLADKELLSPTTFSMSVLNACTGIYSIAKKEHAPSTAISSAESSFGYGLLEACLQFASNPKRPVLFVYADEPAPAVYGLGSSDIPVPLAIGLLLKDDAKTYIACDTQFITTVADPVSQPYAFLECLNGKGTASWQSEGRAWNWSWHEK